MCTLTKIAGRCSPEGPGWGSSRGTNCEGGPESDGAKGRIGAGGSVVVWEGGRKECINTTSNVEWPEEYNNGRGSIEEYNTCSGSI